MSVNGEPISSHQITPANNKPKLKKAIFWIAYTIISLVLSMPPITIGIINKDDTSCYGNCNSNRCDLKPPGWLLIHGILSAIAASLVAFPMYCVIFLGFCNVRKLDDSPIMAPFLYVTAAAVSVILGVLIYSVVEVSVKNDMSPTDTVCSGMMLRMIFGYSIVGIIISGLLVIGCIIGLFIYVFTIEE